MYNVLDNPVWHALNSGNLQLAHGSAYVKYFDEEVSPFVALRHYTDTAFKELYDILPANRVKLLATPQALNIPPYFKNINCVPGLQLVHNGVRVEANPTHITIDLSADHAEEMVQLTKLTNPGPFGLRTIEFGHYKGILNNGKLVAMAGQRMHAANYAEISAVCTHPEFTGRGYARQLLVEQINRIISANETPYLHVKHDNKGAIDLYTSLGFSIRSNMYFYILIK